jgi:hypothetical protein
MKDSEILSNMRLEIVTNMRLEIVTTHKDGIYTCRDNNQWYYGVYVDKDRIVRQK